jgi:hypothetical protein
LGYLRVDIGIKGMSSGYFGVEIGKHGMAVVSRDGWGMFMLIYYHLEGHLEGHEIVEVCLG